MTIQVYVETAARRSFAVAVHWPGLARSGRDETAAVAALAAYRTRYAAVVGADFPVDDEPEVVERLPGGSATEFGVPGAIPADDLRPLDGPELDRQLRLLDAAWRSFDAAAAAAEGFELRKGPRGGGRDLVRIVAHVVEAELSYIARLGERHRLDPAHDVAGAWSGLRRAVSTAVTIRANEERESEPEAGSRLWPVRYFVRRAAWHVLDHAWEVEDRVIR